MIAATFASIALSALSGFSARAENGAVRCETSGTAQPQQRYVYNPITQTLEALRDFFTEPLGDDSPESCQRYFESQNFTGICGEDLSRQSLFDISCRYGQSAAIRRFTRNLERDTTTRRNSGRQVVGTKPAGKPLGRCYMSVQIHLNRAGLTSTPRLVGSVRGATVSANSAGRPLRSQGFVNLLDYPHLRRQIINERNGRVRVPMGACLVYSGGDHGHIECRTPNGYASDYIKPHMRTGGTAVGSNRRLIGVWIDPAQMMGRCRPN
jgi:hypothetical protein